jgi:hypothetical protein
MTQFLASGAATLRVDPLNVVLGLAALVGILTGLAAGFRWLGRKLDQNTQLYRDFYGEARPGVPARPGVLEMIATIHSEITPNHGGSMKDALGRIDDRVATLDADVKGLHDRLEAGEKVQVNVHT